MLVEQFAVQSQQRVVVLLAPTVDVVQRLLAELLLVFGGLPDFAALGELLALEFQFGFDGIEGVGALGEGEGFFVWTEK